MTGRRLVSATVGALCTALSLETCYIPHRLIDGGMTGMAVVLGRILLLQPVYLLVVFNALCLLLAVRWLSSAFFQVTAVALLCMDVVLIAVGPLPKMLSLGAAVVLGGCGVGLGLTLVLAAGGALDGCDVLGQIVQARGRISIVWFLFCCNVIVFMLAVWHHGLWATFPSLVAQVITQLVLAGLLRPCRCFMGP